MRAPSLPIVAIACLGLVLAATALGKTEAPSLDRIYGDAISALAPLASPAELALVRSLEDDAGKDTFLHRFWGARGTEGDLDGRLAAAEHRRRVDEARRRFGTLEGDRARAMVLAGIPDDVTVFGGCRGVIRPMRIWWYQRWQARALLGDPSAEGFYLVFYRGDDPSGDRFVQWSPDRGMGALSEHDAPSSRRTAEDLLDYAEEFRCFRTGQEEAVVVAAALRGAMPRRRLESRIEASRPEVTWLDAFRSELAAGTPEVGGWPVRVEPVGGARRKTIVRGTVQVPVSAVRRNAEGQLFDRLVLRGEARLNGRLLLDRFEHVYHLAGATADDAVELEFYRRLRPGTVEVKLRLEDDAGLALLRSDLEVEVPVMSEAAAEPAGSKMGLAGLTRQRVVTLATFPTVEILAPVEDPVGEVEVEAVTTGGPIARVDFELDGEPVGSDAEPPYTQVLDLGERPERRLLRARAVDAAGREIAVDRLAWAPKPGSFAVRLDLVGGAGSNGEPTHAEARVTLPEGEEIDSLEIFWGQRLLAADTDLDGPAPLLRVPLPMPGDGAPKAPFVRALARLAGGASAEDLVMLGRGESVDVRLVEVYASVLDGRGRPVTGLGQGAFEVLENGEVQALTRVDAVAELPVQVVLAMDSSVSMRNRLDVAAAGARRFFSTVIGDGDRAALVTFNHDLRLAVPFTGDVERLRLGTSGLEPWGGTRLHDALIYATHYFGGQRGRRALVLLSDGRDVESDFPFEQVRSQVLEAGVAVYAILLSVEDEATRSNLERLSSESGGASFAVRGVGQLEGVYRRIEEELRSQYLLVYQSSSGGRRGEFRRVEVKVDGHRTRASRGYYP
ncbi:MAG: VWA domain-containing protein [Acidobacteriota bacterium]